LNGWTFAKLSKTMFHKKTITNN